MSQPIVSIVVITYNSEEFVLETLESAKAQTYQNIELIISDDGSQDNTIKICRKWLKNNKSRFVSTELLNVEKNSGIPANCNRGVKAASGEWIKLIAGDDIFFPDAIEANLKFAKLNNSKFIFTDIECFTNNKILKNDIGQINIKKFSQIKSVKKQLHCFIRKSFFLNSPSHFYHISVYKINKGYDESFKVLEDSPFIMKTLTNNIFIHYFDNKTVKYRINSNSITGSKSLLVYQDLYYYLNNYLKGDLLKGNLFDYLLYAKLYFELNIMMRGYSNNILFRIYLIIRKIIISIQHFPKNGKLT